MTIRRTEGDERRDFFYFLFFSPPKKAKRIDLTRRSKPTRFLLLLEKKVGGLLHRWKTARGEMAGVIIVAFVTSSA